MLTPDMFREKIAYKIPECTAADTKSYYCAGYF